MNIKIDLDSENKAIKDFYITIEELLNEGFTLEEIKQANKEALAYFKEV